MITLKHRAKMVLCLIFVSPVLIAVLLYTVDQLLGTTYLATNLIYLIGLLIGEIVILCLYALIKYHSILRFFKVQKIISCIDESLKSIGAYDTTLTYNVVKTPKIRVYDGYIEIIFKNMNIRNKIEQRIEQLSTALPDNLIVSEKFIDRANNKLVIVYEDLNSDKRLFINTVEMFKKYIDGSGLTEMRIDSKHNIDLLKYPHILISGPTGSGKTYAAQYFLHQSINKGYDVFVLDFKRSYQSFSNNVHFYSEPADIIEALNHVSEIIRNRKYAMDEYLKKNPRTYAYQHGYPMTLVVMEEYLALLNSGISKKEADQIESKIKEIITTGRSLNVHLMMIMQVSAAENLNSSIRANLPVKLVFGNADETTFKTTFGLSKVPPVLMKMEIGEGYGTLDGDIFTFKIPNIDGFVNELLTK